MQWTDLTHALSPTPWAVVGAAATRLYMPERATRDLDILIHAASGAEVRALFNAAGFIRLGDLSIGGATWRSPDGDDIDVIESREVWVSAALLEAQANRDGQRLPVLPLRYLVLMKFQAGRTQDIADISRMLGLASVSDLDAVRALFRTHTPGDLDDLECLIALGKLEMGD